MQSPENVPENEAPTNPAPEQPLPSSENTLIMRFSVNPPTLEEIRAHIDAKWRLDQTPSLSSLDPNHVTIHMASIADTNLALSHSNHYKIKSSSFRLFRWTPDFEIGRDSSKQAVWVKLRRLPLHYFAEWVLYRIGGVLGTVLRIDEGTLGLTNMSYARMCIEMDVAKPLPPKMWIGTSHENGRWQKIAYEGNNAYCEHCCLLGHATDLCRKRRDRRKGVPQVTNSDA